MSCRAPNGPHNKLSLANAVERTCGGPFKVITIMSFSFLDVILHSGCLVAVDDSMLRIRQLNLRLEDTAQVTRRQDRVIEVQTKTSLVL